MKNYSLFFLIKIRANTIIPTVHPTETKSFDLLLLEFEFTSLELLLVSESDIGCPLELLFDSVEDEEEAER